MTLSWTGVSLIRSSVSLLSLLEQPTLSLTDGDHFTRCRIYCSSPSLRLRHDPAAGLRVLSSCHRGQRKMRFACIFAALVGARLISAAAINNDVQRRQEAGSSDGTPASPTATSATPTTTDPFDQIANALPDTGDGANWGIDDLEMNQTPSNETKIIPSVQQPDTDGKTPALATDSWLALTAVTFAQVSHPRSRRRVVARVRGR